MAGFQTFKGSWPWPWIGLYCIPSCITHRPLPTCQILLKSKKNFVHRHIRTYRHLRTILLGRRTRVDLKTAAARVKLTHKCSTISHGNPFIFWPKGQRSRSRVTKSSSSVGVCTLVSAGLFSFSPVQLEGLVDRTPDTHSWADRETEVGDYECLGFHHSLRHHCRQRQHTTQRQEVRGGELSLPSEGRPAIC